MLNCLDFICFGNQICLHEKQTHFLIRFDFFFFDLNLITSFLHISVFCNVSAFQQSFFQALICLVLSLKRQYKGRKTQSNTQNPLIFTRYAAFIFTLKSNGKALSFQLCVDWDLQPWMATSLRVLNSKLWRRQPENG